MMKRTAILLAMLLCCACAHNEYDIKAIRSSVRTQMTVYPASTLKDLYKNFFQDAFGPGHLMAGDDEGLEKMRTYLSSECEYARTSTPTSLPYYESIGWHGRFYRVSLSVINDGKVPFDTFLEAFMESARQFTLPPVEEWAKEWEVIENVIVEEGYNLPGFENDSRDIADLLAGGGYASHHSRQFDEAYAPHYRLIEKEIFESRILPLLEK